MQAREKRDANKREERCKLEKREMQTREKRGVKKREERREDRREPLHGRR